MYDYSYNIQRCLTICNNIHMNDNLLLTTITLSIGNICNIGNADQYFMLTKWTYFEHNISEKSIVFPHKFCRFCIYCR